MKRLFAMIIALVMAVSMTALACAAEAPTAVNDVTAEQSISPRINWDGTAWLVTDHFTTITTSDNIFNDSPLVISDGNNASNVTLRVLNEKGEQVGDTKVVAPGKSVRSDQIPHDSGTYRIQGKATIEGNYYFDID